MHICLSDLRICVCDTQITGIKNKNGQVGFYQSNKLLDSKGHSQGSAETTDRNMITTNPMMD